MKKAIKNLITRLLWDSIKAIMEEITEYPSVVFYQENGFPVEAKNMRFIPQIGSKIWLKTRTEGNRLFKVESMEIMGDEGMEIHINCRFIK